MTYKENNLPLNPKQVLERFLSYQTAPELAASLRFCFKMAVFDTDIELDHEHKQHLFALCTLAEMIQKYACGEYDDESGAIQQPPE